MSGFGTLRHASGPSECPFIGVDRKSPTHRQRDAIDPTRTSAWNLRTRGNLGVARASPLNLTVGSTDKFMAGEWTLPSISWRRALLDRRSTRVKFGGGSCRKCNRPRYHRWLSFLVSTRPSGMIRIRHWIGCGPNRRVIAQAALFS